MQFPVEVCEAVIDQSCDDTPSLHNFSLTCRTLLPRSRYQLFRNIHIRTMEQMESAGDFLDRHPWLPPLVHTVTLSYVIYVREDECKRNTRVLDVVRASLLTRLPNLYAWKMGPVHQCTPHGAEDAVMSLTLHRSVLLLYRIFSSRIQILDLNNIHFYRLSDFTGLISAFTSIHTLICRDIGVKLGQKGEELPTSLSSGSVEGTGVPRTRPPEVTTLKMVLSFDIRVAEYMLFRSRATLSSLTLDLARFTADHIGPLEKLMCWLSQLSSLTLQIEPCSDNERLQRVSKSIDWATRILKSVKGTSSCLTDVQVKFRASRIADLGSLLSGPDALLKDCKLLEEALLAFHNPRIWVHDRGSFWTRRVMGRTEFWSEHIEAAFPTLNKRGLLKFTKSSEISYDPPGHEGYVTSLVISHDSRWIVTASNDDTIIIWDPSSGAVLHEWLAHHHGVCALALSPDSRRLVSAGLHATAVVWAIDDGPRVLALLEKHELEPVKTCPLSPDRDIDDGAPTRTLTPSEEAQAERWSRYGPISRSCAWSSDGALIASSTDGMTVCIWDGGTFQQLDLFLDHHPSPARGSVLRALQFSPDSRYLAWISCDNCCTVWRPLKREAPTRLPSHPDRSGVHTHDFSFDPKSRRIATAHGNVGDDNDPDACVVRVWDVATGTTIAILTGHRQYVCDVSFSPDGKSLLSVSGDISARIWDAESGEQMALFDGADANALFISTACFSPDGNYVAIGLVPPRESQNPVLLWDLRLGSPPCVVVLGGDRDTLKCLAFAPCGNFLASGDERGVVRSYCLS